MKLIIALLAALLLVSCGAYPVKIAKPECSEQNPEDCVYLLKVRGAIPWNP